MFINLDDGRFKCFGCGISGDLVDFHQALTGVDFRTALNELGGELLSLPEVKPLAVKPVNDEAKRERARRIWNESRPIELGDPVDLYLTSRSLCFKAFPKSLHYHPALDYWEPVDDKWVSRGQYPAMIGAITSPDGELMAIHQTYLTTDGAKANVPAPRKIRGPANGGAIHLQRGQDKLAIGEGIETALSFFALTGVAAWACLSTGLMKNIVMPAEVREIILLVDVDSSRAGEMACNKLAERLKADGLTVQLAIPPGAEPKRDWNDYLILENNKSVHRKYII
jgi:putative DNA primase/helicase